MRFVLVLLLCWPLVATAKDYGMKAVDHTLTFDCTTVSPTTGEPTDADSLPSYRVYKDGTFLTGQTGSMTLTDASNTDGYYTATLTLSDANGYTTDSEYTIKIAATVGAVDGVQDHSFAVVELATVDAQGNIQADVRSFLGNLIAESTSDNIAGNFETFFDNADAATTQTVDDVGGSGLDAAGVRAALGMAAADMDTQLDAIVADTGEIGAAGAGLTAVPYNAAWDAEVESEVTDALNVYDPPTDTEMDSGFAGVSSGGGAALYSLVPSGTVVRVMRLDGSTAETPFCALYNATQVYGAANAYTIASTDLSDLADDIPDQLNAITDGNSNTLPIYQASGGHLSSLPTGAWNLHIYQENNLLGEADAVIPVYWDGTTLREATADVRVTVAAIEPGMTQSRVNDPPTYTLKVGNRNQGEFYCNKPVRLRPGAIDTDKAVGIDMSGIFGPHVQVETVGTPTVSDGSITCTELGPRDQLAMVQLGGIATAGEATTVDVEVTMENGDKALVTFEIEVSLR